MIYIQTQQTVFPKSVYIGDRTELRCTFKHEGALAAGAVSMDCFITRPDFSLYDITSVTIQQTDQGYYTLILGFVPWHTGKISFPDFEVQDAGVIHFDDVPVLSLVEQQGVQGIRTYMSPLLLPGTAYKIYAGIALIVVFLIAAIRLVVKRHDIAFWAKNLKLRRRYARNKKIAIKQLRALCSDSQKGQIQLNDSERSSAVQKIMREYLEVRLAYPFTRKLTSELSLAFEAASGGLADENRRAAFEDITGAFVRTDYIRFSASPDAVFAEGEFAALVNNLIDDMNVIEEEPKKNV